VVLLAAGLLSLFPLYWLFLTSLSPAQYVVKVPPEVVPRELTLGNYQRLFDTTPIVRWLVNTVVIAGVITAFHLLFDSMAEFLATYTRVTREDILRNRSNVAEKLGFSGRFIHGLKSLAWLKELKLRLGESLDYAEASVG